MRSWNSDWAGNGFPGIRGGWGGKILLLLGMLAGTSAWAATQTLSPTSCQNVTTYGTQAWFNPGNARASDGNYASVSVDDNQVSNYLQCTGFSFTIPSGATINGITVSVDRYASNSSAVTDAAVRMVKGGSVGSTNKANIASYYGTSLATATYGGSADLWGTTWTPADINASNFGVVFAAQKPVTAGGARTANVDQIRITVDYTVPFSCTPPGNAPSGVALSCVCDTFGRASLNPSTIFGSNWTVSNSDGIGNPYIHPSTGLLRLTENTGNNAKAATVPGIFPAAGNYISVEFLHYAYSGTNPGADGIAVTLSDYSVPAVPGGFGGSLGYAQRSDGSRPPGFAGGWVGIALDEWGNYQNPTEGRVGGPGFIAQSVGVRGPGNGANGYRWIGGTASSPGGVNIDSPTSGSPAPGYMYQVIVDARNAAGGTINVQVNRDSTTRDGSNYAPMMSTINAYGEASYALSQGWISKLIPDYWKISFTGSTGGANNIHEIGGLRICAQTVLPPTGGTASGFSAIDEAYPAAAGSTVPAYQNFQTGNIYMKLAGTQFKLWVAALTNTGISTGYSVAGTKYVQVKLVDNSDNACGSDASRTCNVAACYNKSPVEAGAGATQTAIFPSSGTGANTGVAYPKPSFTLYSAWKNLVAVMRECTDSTCGSFTSTPPACSVDTFSVRPTGVLTVVSSDATNTGTTGTPVFRAGTDAFFLTATTVGISGKASGYTGVLKINNAAVREVIPHSNPNTRAGSLSGTFPAATSGTPSSTATGSFTYSEVGGFRLLGYDPATDATSARAVYDGVISSAECSGLTSAQCDALKAATWTGVDSVTTKGDCVADSFSNSQNGSGKYGCNFGNIANAGPFGRFIPDHFRLSSTSIQNRADLVSTTDGFTYMDEPFRVSFTLTAENGANATTKNYTVDPNCTVNSSCAAVDSCADNQLSKLHGSRACVWNWNNYGTNGSLGPGAVAPTTPSASPLTGRLSTTVSNLSGSFTNGVADFAANLTLTRASFPDGPYRNNGVTDTLVRIGIAPQDSDGVKLLNLNLDAQGATAFDVPDGAAERALLGTLDLRFGRLWLGNAYGSEKRSLFVPYEVQYWNGVAFVKNTDDNGTALVAANFGIGNHTGGLSSANFPVSAIALGGYTAGAGSISLSPPSPSAPGSVDVVARLATSVSMCPSWTPAYPGGTPFPAGYLRANWSCSPSAYVKDPVARATFGIFGSSAKKGPIYIRENF